MGGFQLLSTRLDESNFPCLLAEDQGYKGHSRKTYVRHSTTSVISVLRVHKKVRGRDIMFESNATSHEIMKGKNRGIKILYVIWILGPDLMIGTHALTKRTRERFSVRVFSLAVSEP